MKQVDAVVVAPSERAVERDHARTRRAVGRRARSECDDRRWRAERGAHTAGLRPRRLLGDPPDGASLAVFRDAAPRKIRTRMVRAAAGDGASARRRECGDARAERRSHGGRTGRGCRCVSPSHGALAEHATELFAEILRPIRLVPRHPLLLARFGVDALRSAASVASRFHGQRARGLFAGCAAHSFLPLDRRGSASFGIVLALSGHAVGWSCARGGSAAITNALAEYFESLGGEIVRSHPVRSMRDVPPSRAVIFDVTPRQLARIAFDELPPRYRRKLERFRYGPGVFKIDWALAGPIPWRAAECRRSATVHLGGTFEEIASHESAIWNGAATERPFVLVAQQSLFDGSRAPNGKQTGWAYRHVPHGSTIDMTARIETQIERFAPGFRDLILARHTMNSADFEAHDANFVGGDIAGGANTLLQVIARPFPSFDPYATPNRRLFLGSSSTPPGGGVHGMCGYWAARSALRRVFGVSSLRFAQGKL